MTKEPSTRPIASTIGRRSALRILGISGAAAVLGTRPVFAQIGTELPLVGLLGLDSYASQSYRIDPFMRGLAELGYVEGVNIRFEPRFADGNPDRMSALALELVGLNPRAIVSFTPFISELIAATDTIPIVVWLPAVATYASYLHRPNVTGILDTGNNTRPPTLELALELVPDAGRIGCLIDTTRPDGGAADREEEEAEGRIWGVEVLLAQAGSLDEVNTAFQYLAAKGVGAVYHVPSTMMESAFDLVDLARETRMPTIYRRLEALSRGGLICSLIDSTPGFHDLAGYVDQLLSGVPVSNLRYGQMDSYVLGVNLAAAAEIGFVFPPSILNRANFVIQ